MRQVYLLAGLLALILLPACQTKSAGSASSKPNIIFILADDLGYGDLGSFGQEYIETPHLDQLAAEGMRFTQHYSGSPVCAPSRCILLTGKHSGHAYIRGNHEWGDRGNVWDYHAMIADSTLEGQWPLPSGTTTIGTLLQAEGYRTGMIGKWGLGAPHTEGIPNKQGFDFFCGYNCQRQAHTYYPVHLYLNENRLALDNDTVAPHARLEAGADPYDQASYADFELKEYAPDVMFSEMMNFLEEGGEEPFFLYWASPIPHVALQAPRRWVDYYVEKLGDEDPYLGTNGYYPSRYPRATYAAMISYLDERIGALIAYLKETGEYENTLIIFSSDNGPTFNGGTDSPWFASGGPFNSERGWGKAFLHEGGIRVPMIASWPGKIAPGSFSDHISAFWDLLPTLCEAAGVSVPEGVDGISYLPELTGDGEQEVHPHLYWEFPASGGQQAVRMGKWKAIRKDIQRGNLKLELYNLEEDLQELHDVAEQEPDVVEQMESIMAEEHLPSSLDRFRMKALDGAFRMVDGHILVEAEDYYRQSLTETREWYLSSADNIPELKPDPDEVHLDNAGNQAYLEILPDTRTTHDDELIVGENFSPEPGKLATLHYKVKIQKPGRYYVWVRAYSTGTEDNGIHVGLNGEWPESGQRMQWCEGKDSWKWESRQRTEEEHCGEPYKIYLDIEEEGMHEITFSMREDGFEFDRFLLTREKEYVPSDIY